MPPNKKRKGVAILATIANTDELITTITDLETSVSMPEGTIASKMDATEVNALMHGIEDAFTKLYGKLRLLEDLHDFTKTYIENEFSKNRDAFRGAKAEIDRAADVYHQTTNASSSVSFRAGAVVTDRDGTPVKSCAYIDGKTLVPANTLIQEAEPSSTVVSSNSSSYRRILTPARNYKTFYVNEQPVQGGVEETVQFVFPHAVDVNFTDISAFHADVENVVLWTEDGSKIEIPDGTHMNKRTKVISVSLTLRSTKTETQDIEIAQISKANNTLSPDEHLESIKDTIYESLIRKNGGTTYNS